jgi:hypothetical protein
MIDNCIIDCETRQCLVCGEPAYSCDVKRNCGGRKDRYNCPIGPGTELKKLLSGIGIKAESGCKCADRARHMDFMEAKEPGWTQNNMEEILDWLEEEARKRNLPFVRAGARVLVKLAIRRAKK